MQFYPVGISCSFDTLKQLGKTSFSTRTADVALFRATVEERNNMETYLYNLKTAYEDTLKDKIAKEDLEELEKVVKTGLEVRTARRADCTRSTLARFSPTNIAMNSSPTCIRCQCCSRSGWSLTPESKKSS